MNRKIGESERGFLPDETEEGFFAAHQNKMCPQTLKANSRSCCYFDSARNAKTVLKTASLRDRSVLFNMFLITFSLFPLNVAIRKERYLSDLHMSGLDKTPCKECSFDATVDAI